MKERLWIIPLVICVLLVVLWFFRWEQGPTQTEKDLKLIHMRDRWTGQAWVATYGKSGGKLYSGEVEPVPSPQKIEERKAEILASPVTTQQKQELEKQIENNNRLIKQYEWGHAKFIELAKEIERTKGKEHGGIFDYIFIDYESNPKKYEGQIPQQFINDHSHWTNISRPLKSYQSQLANLPREAEERAMSELKTLAWQQRKIATYIWVALIITSLSFTIFLAIRTRKKYPNSDVTD